MLVKPSLMIRDITTLDTDWLRSRGIRGLIFDLDNTLMAPHSALLEDRMRDWLAGLEAQGFSCVVVSNNPLTGYLDKVRQVLTFPVLGNAGKPRRKFLRKALEILELAPQQVAVVGDRPLTDIWGGQRLGAYTILVDPLTRATEPGFIKLLRFLERCFVITAREAVTHESKV